MVKRYDSDRLKRWYIRFTGRTGLQKQSAAVAETLDTDLRDCFAWCAADGDVRSLHSNGKIGFKASQSG